MEQSAPPAKPTAKAAKGAPVAKSAPAKKQAPSGKKASHLENPLRMPPIDTGLKNKYR
ncbi:MAG: hypothetical protein OQK61_03330 [Ignavibacteriaceae bacterium]|nr:hypothetical protein [Ignavibacteriaceae bacterium]